MLEVMTGSARDSCEATRCIRLDTFRWGKTLEQGSVEALLRRTQGIGGADQH